MGIFQNVNKAERRDKHSERSKAGLARSKRLLRLCAMLVVGASLMLSCCSSDISHKLGQAPQKFVPAQTLRLVDSKGISFAELDLYTDGREELTAFDADGIQRAEVNLSSKGLGLCSLLGGSRGPLPGQDFNMLDPSLWQRARASARHAARAFTEWL